MVENGDGKTTCRFGPLTGDEIETLHRQEANRQLHESHRDKIVVIKFYGSHCQAMAPILAPTLS